MAIFHATFMGIRGTVRQRLEALFADVARMNGQYRIYIWTLAVFGAALPYITLTFFLPDEILQSAAHVSRYFDVPDKLVPEFAFVGVALFISCVPDWLSSEGFQTLRKTRRHWILALRTACFFFAGLSFFHYIRITLRLNGVMDQRFSFNIGSNKLALFWCVVAVVATSLAAIFFYRQTETNQ